MLRDDEVLIQLDHEFVELADPAFRASIKEVADDLAAAGIPPMSMVYARSGTVMGSAALLGPYLVQVASIVVPTLAVVLTAWVKAPGRKVRVKVGDTLIEASSVEEVERLLAQLKEFQGKGSRKKPAA